MTPHTETPTEKALRRQLDEALDEIERLRQAIPTREELTAPRSWGLTRAEEKYLVALLDQKRVDKTAIYNTVYGDDDTGPEIKIVDVIVCKLRKKLKPLGINIVTVWGRGYEVEDRDAVRAMMGGGQEEAADKETNWRDEYKGLEQSFMVLKDHYSEVGRALGFEGDAWFGDPLAKHEEIVKRASALAANDNAPTAREVA